jgi:hypothetical protein
MPAMTPSDTINLIQLLQDYGQAWYNAHVAYLEGPESFEKIWPIEREAGFKIALFIEDL